MKSYDYAKHSSLLQQPVAGHSRSSTLEEPASHSRRGSDTSQHNPATQPLQYANAFRVLKVHPGKWNADLECNLLVRRLRTGGSASSVSTALPEPEPFDALSYHWGLREEGCSVKILAESEAYQIGIRPNLDYALRHLRHATKDVYLWVDALCINQDDNNEKSAQIPLLHFIYNQAQTVRVWIGAKEGDSDLAMDFVSQCLDMAANNRLFRDPVASQDWAALSALMRRPWFSRRWVIQEIASAKFAVVHCGSKEIPWRNFASAVSMLSRRQPELRKLFRESPGHGNHPDYLGDLNELGAIKLAELSDNICRKLADGSIAEKTFSLEALVSSLTTFQASDPHDILYAILWLANDAHPVTKNAYRSRTRQADDTLQPTTPITGPPSPADPSFQPSPSTSEQRERFPDFREDVSSEQLHPTLPSTRSHRASPEASRSRDLANPIITVSDTGSNELANGLAASAHGPADPLDAVQGASAPSALRSDLFTGSQEANAKRGRPASNSISSNSSRSVRPRLALNTPEPLDKDKIYIEWFLDSVQSRRIIVDYNKSVFQVCKDFIEFIVKGNSSLDMLCKPWAPNTKESLPTWMPQLSGSAFAPTATGIYRRVNADSLVGTPGFHVGGLKPYRASGHWPAKAVFGSEDSSSLQVRGFVLDRIREKKAPATGGNIPTEWMEAAGWYDSTQLPPDLFWNTLVGNRDSNGNLPPRYWDTSCREAFGSSPHGGVLNTQDILLNCPPPVAEFVERVQCMVWNRRLVLLERLSRQGKPLSLAIAPAKAKKGDLVCIIHGCSVPVVLRRIIDGQAERKPCEHPECPSHVSGERRNGFQHEAVHYDLIGECYVHGMMNGEALNIKQDGRPLEAQMFDLR